MRQTEFNVQEMRLRGWRKIFDISTKVLLKSFLKSISLYLSFSFYNFDRFKYKILKTVSFPLSSRFISLVNSYFKVAL